MRDATEEDIFQPYRARRILRLRWVSFFSKPSALTVLATCGTCGARESEGTLSQGIGGVVGRSRQILSRVLERDVKRLVGVVLVFLSTRAVALFGLLWLARVAEPSLYATAELALASGLLVSGVGMLGTPGSATRLSLVGGEERVGDYLAFSTALVALPTAILAISSGFLLGWGTAWPLLAGCCALSAAQLAGATYARIRVKTLLCALLDPFATLILLAVALVLYLMDALTLAPLSALVSAISLFIGVGAVVAFWRVRRSDFAAAYMRVVVLGLPILALGGVAMLVGAALRPLLAVRFDLEALALYSLCFRLCAPAFVIYQTLIVSFFARLYRASDKSFDTVASALTGMNCVLIGGIWIVLEPILLWGFPQYASNLELIRALFPAVGAQVALWLISGLLEMKMGRHEIAGRASLAGYLTMSAFAVSVYVMTSMDLRDAVLLFSFAILVSVLAQCLIAWRRGVYLPKTAGAAVGCFGLLALGAALS